MCEHKAIPNFGMEHKWMWKCLDGKLRPVICDGRIYGNTQDRTQDFVNHYSARTFAEESGENDQQAVGGIPS